MTRSTGPTTDGELMTVDPIVIGANAPLDEAADLLDRHGISGVPVVDAAGSLVGVLSQTDLIRARSTGYLWANWPGLAVRHQAEGRCRPMTDPVPTSDRRPGTTMTGRRGPASADGAGPAPS